MALSYQLWFTRSVPQENGVFFHIVKPLLTELVLSRWLDIGLVNFSFFRIYRPQLRYGP